MQRDIHKDKPCVVRNILCKTPQRNPCKRRSSSKHIRIRTHQHIRHHCARAHPRNEHPLPIAPILVQRPLNHAHDPRTIAPAAMRQRVWGRHIPTLVDDVRAVGVDDDESVLRGQVGESRAGEGVEGGSVAPVGVDEYGWVRGKRVGDPEVEACVGGVVGEGGVD